MQVLTQQATQREAADKFGVDRSTVVHICRTAKQGALDALAASVPGRPGVPRADAELAAAREEIERLRATVTEQAVALHLHQGNRVGTDRRPDPAPGGREGHGRPARSGAARRRRGRLVAAAGRGHPRSGACAGAALVRPGGDRPPRGRQAGLGRSGARAAGLGTHLDKTRDPGELEAELERIRVFHNTVRLHQGIGYVTPEDEHTGRGAAIRAARRAGLTQAHEARVAHRRQLRKDHP